MRVRSRRSPLFLLVSSFAITAALAASSSPDATDPKAASKSVSPTDSKINAVTGTKDAPVDGKDGRPHQGPFVEIKGKDKPSKDLPPLKDRPKDPTVVDGKKIPESNDGVMDDKNRPEPKKGTTGTAGGVSEKDKQRKAKEGQTGEKVENKPETPKAAPPLPHSEQEKILSGQDAKKDSKKDKSKTPSVDEVSGLEKPSNLPGKTHDKNLPLPNSAHKDHLDVTKGTTTKTPAAGKTPKLPLDDDGGVIRPFHSFFLSLTMILFSEIGDKTFLVAALMAMKHDRLVVFSAAFSALITMTVLSAVMGHTVPSLLPKRLTSFMAAGLFLVFGVRLLREGMAMSPDEGVSAEMHEVELELEEKETLARKQGSRRRGSVSPYALEMGLGGGSERKSRSKTSRFPTPPRSPSSSRSRSRSPSGRRGGGDGGGALGSALGGLNNLLSLLLSPAWVQTFVMTFLGEWGDRSQIATIAMAAGQDYWWVTLGAVLGHACCTGVAVIGGRAIAGRVSLKVVTVGGAVAFLVFALIYFIEAFYK